MPVSNDYIDYVLEQLRPFGPVTPKRMFGGAGLYRDGLCFALIDNDALYFKVDEQNRADYVGRGRGPFRPYPDKPEYEMGYYDVPGDVLDAPEELARWAEKALAVAAAKKKAPAKKAPAKKAAAKAAPAEKAPAKKAKAPAKKTKSPA
ncbi:TfoX/Sxy family protein [Polyangium sp. 6x1]|uniref:TfoX/Sxy family protein n=1 Tax=Polyangium sp. 6x1 TaxID=3042689 RepID=UPI0024827CF7|nr:TfoX/Sxy family protein [Polyangium sp. 6x1]MDI1445270.1 TfoX/Sxy family protein [Polyangium sp. 6x1]